MILHDIMQYVDDIQIIFIYPFPPYVWKWADFLLILGWYHSGGGIFYSFLHYFRIQYQIRPKKIKLFLKNILFKCSFKMSSKEVCL